MVKHILELEVYKELDNIQNKCLVYPDCNFLTFLFLPFVLSSHSLLSFTLACIINDGVNG